MTGTIRLFAGWRISREIAEEIVAQLDEVREALPKASWVSAENLHMTLAFFGDVQPGSVERLHEELSIRSTGQEPLRSALVLPGFFRQGSKVRAAWIAVDGGPGLLELADLVRDAAAGVGIECDEKPFLPHVTVARPRAPWGEEARERFCEALNPLAGLQSEIDRVSLIRSTPGDRGPVYEDAASIALDSGANPREIRK